MRTIRNILILLSVIIMYACSNDNVDATVETVDGKIHLNKGSVSAPIQGNANTRALYSFQSDNLSFTRTYVNGSDVMFVVNHYLTPYVYKTYGKDTGKLFYRSSTNTFYGTYSTDLYIEPEIWPGVMADTDSLMEVIMDGSTTALTWEQPKDTSFLVDLTNQSGRMEDAFARQLPYTRIPVKRLEGTQIWTFLTSYYWVIFNTTNDIQSIDRVEMVADEPLASKLYWKYTAKPSYLTEYNNPYANGVVWNTPRQAYCFLSFYPGEDGIINNLGFKVTYTLKDGTVKTETEHVRPQQKDAKPYNVYKNLFTLSKEHGLQNMYVDEVLEVDNWSKTTDIKADVSKSGKETGGGGTHEGEGG